MVTAYRQDAGDDGKFFPNNINGLLEVVSTLKAGNMDFRFGTRESVLDNRQAMARRFGLKLNDFAYMCAEMSDKIALVTKANGKGTPCDAMFTAKSRVFPTLLPGDCAPIFIVHRDVWGVIHAGRANASAIVPASISWLKDSFGINPSALIAMLGPTIRDTYVFPYDKRKYIEDQLQDSAWTGHIDEESDGYHVHLDSCVQYLLRKNGVGRIIDLGMDTAKGFFSHSLGIEGRHACFIGKPA
ncbi:MAG: laccase domain-containing protein [Patescibacteria group bacterium]|nr:laccase domain-containing protein [Patescibacteria group bacterium]